MKPNLVSSGIISSDTQAATLSTTQLEGKKIISLFTFRLSSSSHNPILVEVPANGARNERNWNICIKAPLRAVGDHSAS